MNFSKLSRAVFVSSDCWFDELRDCRFKAATSSGRLIERVVGDAGVDELRDCCFKAATSSGRLIERLVGGVAALGGNFFLMLSRFANSSCLPLSGSFAASGGLAAGVFRLSWLGCVGSREGVAVAISSGGKVRSGVKGASGKPLFGGKTKGGA